MLKDIFEAAKALPLVRNLEQSDDHVFSLEILHKSSDDASSETSSVSTRGLRSRELGPTTRGYCAKLFEDALNSSDFVRMKEIFRSFLDPECYMDAYRVENPGCLDSEETLEVRVVGLDNIAIYFHSLLHVIPDSIFLIHEWQVFERRNGQSCVVFSYSCSGNQILPYEQRCNIVDVPKVPTAALAGRKRTVETTHSIKFKDTARGHSTLQEQSRRKRVRTLGEFVVDNRCLPDHTPEISELRTDAAVESWPVGMKPGTSYLSVSDLKGDQINCNSDRTNDNQPSNNNLNSSCPSSDNLSDNTTAVGEESDDIKDKAARSVDLDDIPISNVSVLVQHPALLANAVTVNIRGVMRFHINEDGFVHKIHCSHFAKFNN